MSYTQLTMKLRSNAGFAWTTGLLVLALILVAGLFYSSPNSAKAEDAPVTDPAPEVTEPTEPTEPVEPTEPTEPVDPAPDLDADDDGVNDDTDNCVDVANADQLDSDENGTGDACEESAEGEVQGLRISVPKVDICHVPESGGYIPLSLPWVGVLAHTGANHTGPGSNEDIIPPFGAYPGKNWDAEGQAIHANGCEEPVQAADEITLHTSKIICDEESDLPNWGAVDNDTIDATTATDWMTAEGANKGCYFAEAWNFQWVDNALDAGNPGDNTAVAGGSWSTPFSGSTVIDVSNISRLWFRETTDSNYIPFTGQNTDQNVSAEMYCGSDVLHYDNWEFIDINEEHADDYYCVAWNVPVEREQACKVEVSSEAGDAGIGNGAAVLAWIHVPGWTHLLEGVASWIWDTYQVIPGNMGTDEAKTFTKDFYVDGPVNDATLNLAADNRYWVTINGDDVASSTGEFNYGAVTGPLNVTAFVDSGWNTITMKIENIANGSTNPEENPAAGIYHLLVNGEEKEECDQPDPEDESTLTVVKLVENFFGGTATSSDFNLNVTWYTGNTNDESDPWRGFPGDADGTTFEFNPGTFLVGEDNVPGYSMVIDTNAGPRCSGGQDLHEGEDLTCTVINKQLPETKRGDEVSCEELAEEENGWYGEYFNYSWERPDMYHYYSGYPNETYEPFGDTFGTELWGDPTDPTSTSSDWYDLDDEFRFSRVDADLEFGEYFFPFFNGAVEETTYLPNVDYHFGVHWSATVDVPVDDSDYNFFGKVDDDFWVYVNGVRHDFGNPGPTGVHGPVGISGTLHLSDGDVIDVFYAERSPSNAVMYLEFLDGGISFKPYNDDCNLVCDPEVNLIKNGGFENPELANNSWSIFYSPTALLEWLTGDNGIEIQNSAAGSPFAGEQLAELDPNHPTTIWQDIQTIPGETYRLETQYSPRPGRDAEDNRFEFRVDGSAVGASIARDGSANGDTVWTLESRTFVADANTTSVGFAEVGTDTSYGAYLDEVGLYCIPEPDTEPTKTEEMIVVRDPDLADSILDVLADRTKWFFYNDETDVIDNTLGSFVFGPETAPLGDGSAQMSVNGSQRRNIATYRFNDVPLEDIDALTFSTYSQSAGNGSPASERSAYLHFNVDFNNTDTWQSRLVFVPSLNGIVINDDWQTWDAIDGGNALWLYSGAVWPTTSEAEVGVPGTTAKTWNEILIDYPIAETRSTDSWLGFRVGEPYADGFTGDVDEFIITLNDGSNATTTTFDFEPEEEETSDVTICKYNGSTEGDTLAGWTVWLDHAIDEAFALDTVVEEHDYQGVTSDVQGEGYGCVTLLDVPFGTYDLGENLQLGWSFDYSSEGQSGSVVVDSETESFYIVNDQENGDDDDDDDNDECLVEGYKYDEETGLPLDGWTIGVEGYYYPEYDTVAYVYVEPYFLGSDVTDENGYYCIPEDEYEGPGSNYSVYEELQEGWVVDHATVGYGDADPSTVEDPYVNEGRAYVSVYTLGDTHVNFYNSNGGSITIIKQLAEGDESGESFGFTFSDGEINSPFALVAGASTTFDNLNDGYYGVEEIVPQGWDLASLTCTGEQGEDWFNDVGENGPESDVEILISGGNDIVCTFVNDEPNEGGDDDNDDDNDDDDDGRSGSHRGGGSGGSGDGIVAGASTSFCPFLRDYQHINMQNDPSEVNKAKAFFNSYLGTSLVLDGIFDQAMFDAVWQFQSMFQIDVLNTWSEEFPGVLDNRPTGYLYQTTKWKINSIMCPGYEAFPDQLIIAPGTTVR